MNKNKTKKTLVQILIIIAIVVISYKILETALAFLLAVLLIAFVALRNKNHKK